MFASGQGTYDLFPISTEPQTSSADSRSISWILEKMVEMDSYFCVVVVLFFLYVNMTKVEMDSYFCVGSGCYCGCNIGRVGLR